jgi:hypothetical protein
MSSPATGGTWKQVGLDVVDNRFYDRGGKAAVLIRDNRGVATDVSPYHPGTPNAPYFSPFAQDGQLRKDLFAMQLVDGIWQVNPDPNQGWWLVGAMDERGGPDRKPNIRHDDAMILQSTFPFDTDLTAEGLTLQFTPVEVNKPLIRRLRMNLPLTDESGNSLVEGFGGSPYNISKPVDGDDPDRQIMLIFQRTKGGKSIWRVEIYPLVKNTDLGNAKRDKTAPDAGPLTYTVLPDPFHIDLDPTISHSDALNGTLIPALYSEWVGGDGWNAIAGNPVFPGLAPFAEVTGGTTVALQFQDAIGGGGETETYTVEKFQSGAWSSATLAATHTDTPVEGATTLDITGLAAGTAKFRVTATGENTSTSVSQNSNQVTLTGP